MARALTFTIAGQTFACGVEKLDRKKLYGFRRRQVLDDQNRPCKLGLLCEDGRSLLGPGGVAMTYLDQQNDWVDRSTLQAVDDNGKPLPLIPSSYDGPITLHEKVSVDEVAALIVRDVLQIAGPVAEPLRAALGDDVYRFTYCYRADYHGETAYLLSTPEGVFALVGEPAPYHFVGLQTEVPAAAEEENDDLGADEDLDFGMM